MTKEDLGEKEDIRTAAKEIIRLERNSYYGDDNTRDRLRRIREILDQKTKQQGL